MLEDPERLLCVHGDRPLAEPRDETLPLSDTALLSTIQQGWGRMW